MTSIHDLKLRILLAGLFFLGAGAVFADEPIDILRHNVEQGLVVLKDPSLREPSQRLVQRDKLCHITQELFDPHLVARLALGAEWKSFEQEQRSEFVEVFATYFCHNYLDQLQAHYENDDVVFVDQTLKNDSRASVRVEVTWQGKQVPLEIRMARHAGEWKAYDAIFLGISTLRVYKAQFRAALKNGSPTELIAKLQQRVALNS